MAFVALTATPVAAAECLLDTKNDGVAVALDTDGGAASSDPTALACGFAANANWAQTTAVGTDSLAVNAGASSVGANAQALQTDDIAIGRYSVASGGVSIAIGSSSNSLIAATATGNTAIAIGFGCDALQFGSLAIGTNSQSAQLVATALGSNARALAQSLGAINDFTLATGVFSTAFGVNAMLSHLALSR